MSTYTDLSITDLSITDLYTTNLFLVTQHSVGNEPVLGNEMMMRLMRSAVDWTMARTPFDLIGYVFLPEQAHLVLKPTGQAPLDRIMQQIRRRFHQEYHELLNMPGETLLWQNEHVVRRVEDVEELANYLDFIHYEPVQRGYVEQPAAWPYSSFALWQERGIYPVQWGWKRPAMLNGEEI